MTWRARGKRGTTRAVHAHREAADVIEVQMRRDDDVDVGRREAGGGQRLLEIVAGDRCA